MKRQARVVKADGADRALVELDAVSQCLRCRRGHGCGAAILASQQSAVQLWVAVPGAAAETGQRVELEVDEHGSGWLWPVFAAYGLPLIGLLVSTSVATAMVGTVSASAELFIVVSALLGLCGGIFAWRQLAPGVLARAERSLCLRSARIVAMNPVTEREPR